jgi:hypothetical protein
MRLAAAPLTDIGSAQPRPGSNIKSMLPPSVTPVPRVKVTGFVTGSSPANVRVLATTVLLSAAVAGLARHLIVNSTESMPLGLYWLSRGQPPHRRDLVAFPDNVRELVHDRRYLPDGALLLK